MFSGLLKDFYQLIIDHFEAFICVVLFLLVMVALSFIMVKFKELTFPRVFHLSLMSIFSLGLILCLVLLGYIFWADYRYHADLFQFPKDVLPNTHWVKQNLKVFFINGKRLMSTNLNGQDRENIFKANDLIREYHFSPDGQYLVIVTFSELYVLNRQTKKKEFTDTIMADTSLEEEKGVISGIRWAPDSRKFCYEIAQWSKYSSKDNLYLYDLLKQKKQMIESPMRKISSPYWDQQGENLYYLYYAAREAPLQTYSYDVKIFRIPLDTLKPEFVSEIPYEAASLPLENLSMRGINLYLKGDQRSFVLFDQKESLISKKGSTIVIDQEDYLSVIKNKWFKKRLFKVPRELIVSEVPTYPYKGGDLTIKQIRWLPGGRYVIMKHSSLGILVLEPLSGMVGILEGKESEAVGWYES